jgi:hypothetical protein
MLLARKETDGRNQQRISRYGVSRLEPEDFALLPHWEMNLAWCIQCILHIRSRSLQGDFFFASMPEKLPESFHRLLSISVDLYRPKFRLLVPKPWTTLQGEG